MKNFDDCLAQLMIALNKIKDHRPERLFAVGRNCVQALDPTESMQDIVAGMTNPALQFAQENAQYLESISSSTYLAFFDITPEEITIAGVKHTAHYKYDQQTGAIIVTII